MVRFKFGKNAEESESTKNNLKNHFKLLASMCKKLRVLSLTHWMCDIAFNYFTHYHPRMEYTKERMTSEELKFVARCLFGIEVRRPASARCDPPAAPTEMVSVMDAFDTCSGTFQALEI